MEINLISSLPLFIIGFFMGLKIGELIEKEEISLDYLSGKIVGIDTYNILYQFLSSIRNYDGTPLMDKQGNITSHLSGVLYRTTNLLQRGIKPVFVFDGKHSKLKAETIRKRQEIRTQAEIEHKKALKEARLEEARKAGSRALKLTKEMVQEAKNLIELMGLPVVQAENEGEAQIAFMVEKGDLYGCVSQDYDALLFGSKLLFRNITVSGKRKVPGKSIYIDVEPEKIELKKVLEHLGITRQKLVWLGILTGTDFNEKFPKIGPKTGLKLVQEFDSFEEIIKETNFEPNFDYKEIEELFLKPEAEKNYKIEFKVPEKEKVIDFLCSNRDFSMDRVENALNKLEAKVQEKGTQSSLGKWL